MRADLAQLSEPVTLAHRVGARESGAAQDVWRTTTYPACQWHGSRESTTDTQGQVSCTSPVVVHVPEDQGECPATIGDYVVRGEMSYDGPYEGLRDAMAGREARKVTRVRKLSCKALSGLTGPVARYARETVVEAV